MPTEKSDLLQGTLDMLILKIVALGPVHGYGISLRIRQISHDVLQVQQGSLYPAWKNEDGLPLSGASPKRVGRPSFTSYRRRAASNWRAKNRTGSGWLEQWSTFCKPWNRSLSCLGGNPFIPSARPMSK